MEQKISFFNNNFSIGVDYSDLDECIGISELSEEQLEILKSGMDYKLIFSDKDSKICEVEFFKGEKYTEIQEKIKEEEKEKMIERYRELQKKIIETRAEIEDLQDNIEKGNIEEKMPVVEKRIQILEERRTRLRNEQDLLSDEGIKKYGIEILNDF